MTIINIQTFANLSALYTMQSKEIKRIHAKNQNIQYFGTLPALMDTHPQALIQRRATHPALDTACEELLTH